jgi:type IV secretory pathway VirJ component
MDATFMKIKLSVIAGVLLLIIWQPWQYTSALKQSIVITPAQTNISSDSGANDKLVIFYSGDGGWGTLEREITETLNSHDIPVVGINSSIYFWRERSVEEYAAELDTLITQYSHQWNKQHVWLIGFSFGANVLPSITNKLSQQNRVNVEQLTMLEPTDDVFFEIEIEKYMTEGGWNINAQRVRHGIRPVKHYDPLIPLNTLQDHPRVFCYYGKDAVKISLCTQPSLSSHLTAVPRDGSHYFNNRLQEITQVMIGNLPKANSQ